MEQFTDDDIKRMKEDNKKRKEYNQRLWDETKGTEREGSAMGAADDLRISKDIEALLNRLEAAERYIQTCRDYCCDIFHKPQVEAYGLWKKASGK